VRATSGPLGTCHTPACSTLACCWCVSVGVCMRAARENGGREGEGGGDGGRGGGRGGGRDGQSEGVKEASFTRGEDERERIVVCARCFTHDTRAGADPPPPPPPSSSPRRQPPLACHAPFQPPWRGWNEVWEGNERESHASPATGGRRQQQERGPRADMASLEGGCGGLVRAPPSQERVARLCI